MIEEGGVGGAEIKSPAARRTSPIPILFATVDNINTQLEDLLILQC
jgi:hypothetical protein